MLVSVNNIPNKIKKDGTEGKHRDLSLLRTVGNKVNTNYGMFTVLAAKKEGKIWYITLTDGTKTITVKQPQLFNKKLPKTATVQTTLMLAQPKELIDQLVEQVERLVQQYNEPFISNPANYTSKGKLKTSIRNMLLDNYQQFIQEPQYNTQFANKVDFIANALDIIGNITITKKIGRILKRNYHPDSNIGSTEKFMLINKLIRY